METKFESKIGRIRNSAEVIYNKIADFRNFSNFIPADKIKNWQASANECRFSVDMIGETGLKIIEKRPSELIKITTLEENEYNFILWIQLKEVAPYDTRIKLTIKVNLNPVIKMVVSNHIQNFLDNLVTQLEKISF